MQTKESSGVTSKTRLDHRKKLEIKLSEIKQLENMHEELFSEVGFLIQKLIGTDREALSGATDISHQIETNRDIEVAHLRRLFFDATESFQQQKSQISKELNDEEDVSDDH